MKKRIYREIMEHVAECRRLLNEHRNELPSSPYAAYTAAEASTRLYQFEAAIMGIGEEEEV